MRQPTQEESDRYPKDLDRANKMGYRLITRYLAIVNPQMLAIFLDWHILARDGASMRIDPDVAEAVEGMPAKYEEWSKRLGLHLKCYEPISYAQPEDETTI